MLILRSLLFNTFMYVWMLILGVICAPLALLSRDGAYWTCRFYCDTTLWVLYHLCGLRTEVRGTVPVGEVLVASKHQSFLDILILYRALPRAKFIMKKELKWAPILGFYAMRIGCAPVDRGKKGKAMTQMVSEMGANTSADDETGQVVIYPQGTRVTPGVKAPYTIGAAVLYDRFGLDCVPVATNAGVFWGRNEVPRRPGVAVIEFLEPIPAGMGVKSFAAEMEARVEAASDALLAEAVG